MQIPFGNVFAIMLYLVPGFIARQVYRWRYTAARASDLESLIWSLVHTFIIYVGLTVVSVVTHLPTLNLIGRLREAQGAIPIDTSIVVVLLVSGIVWGLLMSLLHWARSRIPFLPTPDPQGIWPYITQLAPEHELWALVRTKDGPLYLGWIDSYAFNPDEPDQDFYLKPALRVDEAMQVQQDLSAGGVYLNTRDVRSVELIEGMGDQALT